MWKSKSKKLMAIFIIFAISLSVFIVIPQLESFAAQGNDVSFDVVFAIDNSGSMTGSDPNHLAFIAAQIFIDLCSNSNSRIGYVMFSDKIRDKIGLVQADNNHDIKETLANATYPENGWTDIGLALEESYKILKNGRDGIYKNKQVIILLTDGKIELGNSQAENTSVNKVDSIVSLCKNDKVPIYTIGLNYNDYMDAVFLNDISNKTSALPTFEAKTADVLSDYLNQIYSHLLQGSVRNVGKITCTGSRQEVPIDIPADVFAANVIITSENASVSFPIRELYAIKPDGSKYVSGDTVESERYAFLKIKKPEKGTWKISFIGTKDNVVSIDYITVPIVYPTYDVVFETNGGSTVQTAIVEEGKKVSKPVDPTKTDERFSGWYSNIECTQMFDFNTAIMSSITLYAKWLNGVVVSFDTQGGSEVAPIDVKKGDSLLNIELPKTDKTDYDFLGWFSDADTKTPVDINASIHSDMTLYAGWTPVSVKISFDTQGGEDIPPINIVKGQNIGTLPVPIKKNSKFVAWFSSAEFITAFTEHDEVSDDIILYAQWKEDKVATVMKTIFSDYLWLTIIVLILLTILISYLAHKYIKQKNAPPCNGGRIKKFRLSVYISDSELQDLTPPMQTFQFPPDKGKLSLSYMMKKHLSEVFDKYYNKQNLGDAIDFLKYSNVEAIRRQNKDIVIVFYPYNRLGENYNVKKDGTACPESFDFRSCKITITDQNDNVVEFTFSVITD